MISLRSLRARMMLLFCIVVGVLWAGSDLAFYEIFARVARSQFDHRLLEAASPVVADIIKDPDEEDVSELNLPGEYFELLDASGRVLQHSGNLKDGLLDLGQQRPDSTQTVFRNLEDAERGRLRLAVIQFRQGHEQRTLAVAMPTREVDEALRNFRRVTLVLFPVSLVLTALISAWYVGRSLRPIADLTGQAALMTERIQRSPAGGGEPRQGLVAPLRIANPHDELGRLGATFNRLFASVDAAVSQLREFVSNASHELRTPLSILQGETELLLSEPRSTEEYEKTLKVIDGELKKLSRIVEGLFTLALADAGQLRLASEPLYLNEVLEETCALVTPQARARGMAIERALGEEFPYHGDEVLLRQLFLIFLENAIKYSSANTRIQVSLEQRDLSLRVIFQDEGIGISAEDLPHVFERFYRAAKPESGEAQSGGLGLAIAQAIARSYGGSIECKSMPGVGSTFTVLLPLRPQAAPEGPRPREKSSQVAS